MITLPVALQMDFLRHPSLKTKASSHVEMKEMHKSTKAQQVKSSKSPKLLQPPSWTILITQ